MTTKQQLGLLASLLTIVAGAITIYALFTGQQSPSVQTVNNQGVMAGGDAHGNTVEHNKQDVAGEAEHDLRKYAGAAAETCRTLTSDIAALPDRPTSVPSSVLLPVLPPELYPIPAVSQRFGEAKFRSLDEQYKQANMAYGKMYAPLMITKVARDGGMDTTSAEWDKHYESFVADRRKTADSLIKLCEHWERLFSN